MHKIIFGHMLWLLVFFSPVTLPADVNDKTLRFALSSPPDSFDVLRTELAVTIAGSSLLYLPLISHLNIPRWQLLKHWEVSDNGLDYTFKFRDDLVWSDGSLFSSEDWITAIKYQLDENLVVGGGFTYFYNNIAKDENGLAIRQVDNLTVKVSLSKPSAFFLDHLTAFPATVLHTATYNKYGANWHLPENIVTLAPYRLEQVQLPDSITMVKNEDFPGSDELEWQRIKFFFIPEIAKRLQAMKNGQVDVVSIADISSLHGAMQLPGKKMIKASVNSRFIVLNPKSKLLANPELREAIALLVDPETLTYGTESAVEQPLHSLVPEAVDKNYHAAKALKQPQNPESRNDDFARAEAILAKLGITKNTPQSFDLKVLKSRSVVQPMKRLAEIARRYGLILNLILSDEVEHYKGYFAGDYELIVIEWFQRIPSSIESQFTPFDSRSVFVGHGYNNLKYMKWANALDIAANKSEAYEAMRNMEAILLEDHYVLPYSSFSQVYLLGEDIDPRSIGLR